MDTLGERLKYLRVSKDIRQQTVSEATGISRSNISKIESNNLNPTANAIVALAKFFNVSTDWILLGKEENAVEESITHYDKVASRKRKRTVSPNGNMFEKEPGIDPPYYYESISDHQENSGNVDAEPETDKRFVGQKEDLINLESEEEELIKLIRELPEEERYETIELISSMLKTKRDLHKKRIKKQRSSIYKNGEEAAGKMA